ncbi:MAG: DCC1-like thiol-disulfide oxidoreductase family protein [Pirellulales bacterium]
MSTDLMTSEKLLAYDGDCPMCLATIALLLRLRLIRPEQTRSNHELDRADLLAAQQAGLRNQLVVLDLQSREARVGSDALLWIIGDNTGGHFLVRLLGWPGFRHLLRYGYETISYNRRVISPPRHQVVCDCEPEVTVERRLTLIMPLALASIALAAGFGAAVFVGWGLGDAITGAIFIQIAAGSGWVAMIAAGLVLLRGMQRIDYVAHLVVTMFTGALALVPAAVLTLLLPRPVSIAIASLSVLAAFALMFAMQRRRVAAISLRSVWLWAWAVVVVVTLTSSIVSHFREQIF